MGTDTGVPVFYCITAGHPDPESYHIRFWKQSDYDIFTMRRERDAGRNVGIILYFELILRYTLNILIGFIAIFS